MAAALARRVLADLKGVTPDGLSAAGVRVRSAGVSAVQGGPATPEAAAAVKPLGGDLSSHASQPVTEALIQDADVIYTMTEAHRRAVLAYSPGAAAKTHRLDPERDVSDPIGMSQGVYDQTARMIHDAVRARVAERYPDAAAAG
jgi:protein-tyrosine phosphatase